MMFENWDATVITILLREERGKGEGGRVGRWIVMRVVGQVDSTVGLWDNNHNVSHTSGREKILASFTVATRGHYITMLLADLFALH